MNKTTIEIEREHPTQGWMPVRTNVEEEHLESIKAGMKAENPNLPIRVVKITKEYSEPQ